ncbi:MAG: ACP S-malonyltransferase [Chloroflexi bacterium]|nr:ACP S-malonyltransferase [Chloroflexota bacterium]
MIAEGAETGGSLALTFPGQGSQWVGMGRSLYDRFASVRRLYAEADDRLEVSLSSLSFDGPEDELRDTANAQPAILVASVAALTAARELEVPWAVSQVAFLAGHSLGEYSALVAAESLSFADALSLVRQRGLLMQRAGEQAPGTMAAIMGLDTAAVETICAASGAEMANLNSPGQTVVSGCRDAVEGAVALARQRGAKATLLNVSAAFHSSLMASAAAELAQAIQAAAVAEPRVPVVGNTSARAICTEAEVRAELVEQLLRPVRWQATVELMAAGGVRTFVEVGPGKTLTGLVRRIVPEGKAFSWGDRPE